MVARSDPTGDRVTGTLLLLGSRGCSIHTSCLYRHTYGMALYRGKQQSMLAQQLEIGSQTRRC